MKAVRIIETGKAAVVTDATLTNDLRPDEILVKTIAVALNPTDWKHIEFGDPSTVGCDYSGVVQEVGSAVTRFKKGDRVWGLVHGSNKVRPDTAAFQEYLYAKEGVSAHVPENMSFEEAASLGVGVMTTGQGLYQEMPLPWPDSPLREKIPILIWGGSSATGAIGIQFAKASGFEVITTCSQHNFDYVKSLGADAVFDSHSATVGDDIRAYTNDKLYYAWDTIGEYGSEDACAKALASTAPEGQNIFYGTILAGLEVYLHRNGKMKSRPDDVIFSCNIGYTAMGEAFENRGVQFPARPEDAAFSKKWMPFAGELIAQGKIKPHRIDIREGGFDAILGGLDEMKNGKVSGVKLVYRVAEPRGF